MSHRLNFISRLGGDEGAQTWLKPNVRGYLTHITRAGHRELQVSRT